MNPWLRWGMNQENLVSEYQQIGQQLLRISKTLNQIYQDQMDILSDVHVHNLFRIDQEQHQVSIANGLFQIHFQTPNWSEKSKQDHLIHYHFEYLGQHAAKIEKFIRHDLYFLTGDLKPQHSLFLRNKAKQLRALFIEQTYQWVDGPARVRDFFQHISLVQAEIIDHLLIRAKLYKQPVMLNHVQKGQPISEVLLETLSQIFSLDVLCGERILPLQSVMESLDDFCFSAAQFLPKTVHRVASLSFEERFSLNELSEIQDDIYLLARHAQQHSHLLGFTRLMNREYCSKDNSLAKENFIQEHTEVWQKKIAKLPIFHHTRTVNWLFKQSSEVVDWISQNIQHSSIRVAITALSFVDTSQMHPQVILATLQHFQFASARMFIHSCYFQALQDDWFEHPKNTRVCLKEHSADYRVAISSSILYLDEWMQLMQDVLGDDQHAVKRVYGRLSRVMQAYMLHLHQVSADLPVDLMHYIRSDTQQNRDFLAVLCRHHIQVDAFRQRFYLTDGHIRESVFDSYVRDYLADLFAQNKDVPKNTTWLGLFAQAVKWHDQIQKQDILNKLKKTLSDAKWDAVTTEKYYLFEQWTFEELKNLDRIIGESKSLRHCLASSYAQRIVEGEYVAFHMSHPLSKAQLTLGCYLRDGQVMFDQLEYANNQKADVEQMHIAVQFIEWLNAQGHIRI